MAGWWYFKQCLMTTERLHVSRRIWYYSIDNISVSAYYWYIYRLFLFVTRLIVHLTCAAARTALTAVSIHTWAPHATWKSFFLRRRMLFPRLRMKNQQRKRSLRRNWLSRSCPRGNNFLLVCVHFVAEIQMGDIKKNTLLFVFVFFTWFKIVLNKVWIKE